MKTDTQKRLGLIFMHQKLCDFQQISRTLNKITGSCLFIRPAVHKYQVHIGSSSVYSKNHCNQKQKIESEFSMDIAI